MKKRMIAGVVGVAAVALVGGTFAYFTQTTTVENPFDTGFYNTVVTEKFNPSEGENWEPGVEVDKDIYVENTGDRPVVVRVKFEEEWNRKYAEEGRFAAGRVFKSNDAHKTMSWYQEDTKDGLVENDNSVVQKILNLENSRKWSSLQADGYYYYLTQLQPEENTGTFLDSVRLARDLDLGHFQSTVYYKVAGKNEQPTLDETWTQYEVMDGKVLSVTADMMKNIRAEVEATMKPEETLFTTVVVEAEDDKLGYSDADYVLSITIETVQATDKAVLTAFGVPGNDTYKQGLYDAWNLKAEDLETE